MNLYSAYNYGDSHGFIPEEIILLPLARVIVNSCFQLASDDIWLYICYSFIYFKQ